MASGTVRSMCVVWSHLRPRLDPSSTPPPRPRVSNDLLIFRRTHAHGPDHDTWPGMHSGPEARRTRPGRGRPATESANNPPSPACILSAFCAWPPAPGRAAVASAQARWSGRGPTAPRLRHVRFLLGHGCVAWGFGAKSNVDYSWPVRVLPPPWPRLRTEATGPIGVRPVGDVLVGAEQHMQRHEDKVSVPTTVAPRQAERRAAANRRTNAPSRRLSRAPPPQGPRAQQLTPPSLWAFCTAPRQPESMLTISPLQTMVLLTCCDLWPVCLCRLGPPAPGAGFRPAISRRAP